MGEALLRDFNPWRDIPILIGAFFVLTAAIGMVRCRAGLSGTSTTTSPSATRTVSGARPASGGGSSRSPV